jgi:hypothetical protein
MYVGGNAFRLTGKNLNDSIFESPRIGGTMSVMTVMTVMTVIRGPIMKGSSETSGETLRERERQIGTHQRWCWLIRFWGSLAILMAGNATTTTSTPGHLRRIISPTLDKFLSCNGRSSARTITSELPMRVKRYHQVTKLSPASGMNLRLACETLIEDRRQGVS